MKKILPFLLVIFAILISTAPAKAHRSGCHRWHSCPSDSGSYTCGDAGYPCQYPTYPASGGVIYPPSGYYKDCYDCPLKKVPNNSYTSGISWTCNSGYKKVGQGCVSVVIPPNARLSILGSDWKCNSGYKKVGQGCVIINNTAEINSKPSTIKTGEVAGVKIISDVVTREKSLLKTIDKKLSSRMNGRILLQVEDKGEAWYVAPKTSKRHYMANGDEAYSIMRNLGVGITDKDLDRVKTNKTFAKQHSGKIFLQVEAHGEAYYIDVDGNAHYLKDGSEAYNIMRELGLGITNNDLRKIDIN